MEICPSCGAFVEELRPNTGWCAKCTGDIIRTCIRCGDEFETKDAYICGNCVANEIEELMCQGHSYTKSKLLVANRNIAVCLCCGESMPHATKGRHIFCTVHRDCRYASRRVKYLRLNKGIPKEDAIRTVLAELQSQVKAA